MTEPTDRLKNSENKAIIKSSYECSCGGKGSTEIKPRNYENLFLGWFNNHMSVVFISLERIRPRSLKVLSRIDHFLFDLEHHYVDLHVEKRVRNAFKYLRLFFSMYPAVSHYRAHRAFEMIQIIYQSFGIHYKYQRSWAPKPIHRKKRKQTGDRLMKIDTKNLVDLCV